MIDFFYSSATLATWLLLFFSLKNILHMLQNRADNRTVPLLFQTQTDNSEGNVSNEKNKFHIDVDR